VPKAFRAPCFGPRHAIEVTDKNGNPKTDTAYFTITPFKCRTVSNAAFDSHQLDGNLYAAIFASPDSVLDVIHYLAEDLKMNREKYNYARFAFFCPVDSNTVTLPDYAKDLNLGKDTAFMLYMDRAMFDSLHDKYYFTPDPARKKDPWGSRYDAVLIDRLGRIRGYYNIRSVSELKKLREDIPFIHQYDEAAETIESSTIKQERK
jgi:hypothetical protein